MSERRVSLMLPDDLVERVEAQARSMGISRQDLMAAAVEGLVREFEEIDVEYPPPKKQRR